MLTHTDLKKGVRILLDKEPYEILEANAMKKAQRRPVIQTKIKNLLNGNVYERNFQQGDVFEEPELSEVESKFLYSHRDRYFFCKNKNTAERFDLDIKQLKNKVKFLKKDLIVKIFIFNDKVINISLPIKVQLRVTEAPPGIKGDRAQGGTKLITIETGAKISAPLFVKEGNTIEINTETEEYVKRIE